MSILNQTKVPVVCFTPMNEKWDMAKHRSINASPTPCRIRTRLDFNNSAWWQETGAPGLHYKVPGLDLNILKPSSRLSLVRLS
jgi:hypothetical protein